MKRILLLMAVILVNLSLFAKGIKVVSDRQLAVPDEQASYSPLISPAGDYILLTSGTMQGLKKYDLNTGKLSTITSDEGAGYNACMSDDGNIIVYRESVFKNHLRYSTVKSVNLESGKTQTLVRNSRNITAYGIEDGTALALENGSVKMKKMAGKTVQNPVMVSIYNGNLMLTRNGLTYKLNPCGDTRYLWQSLSPDGKKVLFAVPGKESVAYVCNLDGRDLVRLGKLSAPRWMGNDWVVGMDDKDNGEFFTASVIVAVRADGRDYTVLTDGSKIAMYPTASLDATKIVYNTTDGKIFMMNVVAEY